MSGQQLQRQQPSHRSLYTNEAEKRRQVWLAKVKELLQHDRTILGAKGQEQYARIVPEDWSPKVRPTDATLSNGKGLAWMTYLRRETSRWQESEAAEVPIVVQVNGECKRENEAFDKFPVLSQVASDGSTTQILKAAYRSTEYDFYRPLSDKRHTSKGVPRFIVAVPKNQKPVFQVATTIPKDKEQDKFSTSCTRPVNVDELTEALGKLGMADPQDNSVHSTSRLHVSTAGTGSAAPARPLLGTNHRAHKREASQDLASLVPPDKQVHRKISRGHLGPQAPASAHSTLQSGAHTAVQQHPPTGLGASTMPASNGIRGRRMLDPIPQGGPRNPQGRPRSPQGSQSRSRSQTDKGRGVSPHN